MTDSVVSPRTVGVAICLISILACSRPDPARELIARNYPRVDGSTSTHPLSMLVACKIRGIEYEWKRPPALERTVFPSHARHPIAAAEIENRVHHHGTHEAYVALIQNQADLILVAREPSSREIDAARRAGVRLDVTPIARDALVFVLNVKNPVENLTRDQIRRIFGAAPPHSWAAFGGPDAPVEAYQREPDSGSQELMEKLLMKDLPIREMPRIYTMAGVVNSVAMRDAGIAYSIYYYVTNMAPNRNVKMIAVDGVKPAVSAIANRTYPLTSEVFAVVRGDSPADSPAVRLRAWLLSRDGQAAVQESGYVQVHRS